jgi:hypothetical protein
VIKKEQHTHKFVLSKRGEDEKPVLQQQKSKRMSLFYAMPRERERKKLE